MVLWTSHISSYANLVDHVSFVEPPLALQSQLQHAMVALNDLGANFTSLVTDFLQGSGVPCPHLFDEAKIYFNKIVDLSQIDADGFRARMFCWAATGSSDQEQSAPQIKVSTVEFSQGPELICVDFRFVLLPITILVTAKSRLVWYARARCRSERATILSISRPVTSFLLQPQIMPATLSQALSVMR